MMNTQEKLERIKARCHELLAIAEKRTPGKWVYEGRRGGSKYGKPDGWGASGLWVVKAPTQVFGTASGWDGNFDEPSEEDAAYIASCAGPAEAGWRATIAAIEFADWENEHWTLLADSIIAAWPDEIFDEQKP